MLGLGFCYSHVDLLYELADDRYLPALALSDLVSVAVFLAGAFLAYKLVFLHRRGIFLLGTPVVAIAGMVVLKTWSTPTGTLVGTSLMALGFTLVYLLWLELYGCMSPANVAIALSGSCLVHVVLSGILQGMTDEASFACMLSFPILSVLCLTFGSRSIADAELPCRKPPVLTLRFRILVLWAFLFGVATGFGRDTTGVDIGASIGMAGHAIPALVVLVGSLFFSKRFDFRTVYAFAAPLMAVGVAIVIAFGRDNPYLGQLFVGAGSEGCALLVVIIACGLAYMSRSSAIFGCGILFGVECAGFLGGSALADFSFAAQLPIIGAYAVGAILVLAVIASTIVVFRHEDVLSSQYSISGILDLGQDEVKNIDGFVKRIADEHSLSPAETTVLTMLAQGATREAISKELFIAPVTVRVHISRICKKLEMPSASELETFIEKQGLR